MTKQRLIRHGQSQRTDTIIDSEVINKWIEKETGVSEKNMITKKTWNEFRETGLFLLMNQFLHIFGWALVVEVTEDGKVTECYPARTKFRGFGEKNISEAYQKVSKYMADNATELYEETKQ